MKKTDLDAGSRVHKGTGSRVRRGQEVELGVEETDVSIMLAGGQRSEFDVIT